MSAKAGLVALFLVISWAASGQTVVVTYLDGEASVNKGSSPVELAIGDAVPQNATVRLGKDSYLELRSAGATIKLSERGSYSVHDLLSASAALISAGVGRALSTSLAHLLTGPAANRSTVLGARGADESNSEDAGWVENGAAVFFDAVQAFIASGQYDKAIAQLKEALAASTEDELPEVTYDLAYAYSLSGDTREALIQMAGVEPKGTEEWVPGFVLLKAKLLVDANAFAQAIAWLVQPGNDLSGDAQLSPAYNFLLGIGYRGLSDLSKERQALSKVIAIAADSDLAASAKELLQKP